MAPFDSYEDLLVYACTLFQPKNVLEYGTGGSTRFFLKYSEAHIHSIEHNSNWYSKYDNEIPKEGRLELHLIQDHEDYITCDFGLKYDLIFVDGLCAWRTDCLKRAIEKLTPGGYVILHDSERHDYDEGTVLYKEILTIEGTTLYEPLER